MRKYLSPILLALLPLTVGTAQVAQAEQPSSLTQADPAAKLAELQKKTSSTAELDPVTDLDGYLVKLPADSSIYLVMDGFRRHIPDAATYGRLFKSTCTVWDSPFYGVIPKGAPLVDASLLRGWPSDAMYLFVDGHTRYIPSPAIMDKYCFDISKAFTALDATITFIPAGPPLD